MSAKKYKLRFFSYILLMAIPGVLSFLPWNSADSTNNIENRILAQWPSFDATQHDVRDYRNRIEDYLEDRLGLKNAFVKLYNNWLYLFFNKLSSTQVSTGENGFIYLNSHSKNQTNGIFDAICSQELIPKVLEKQLESAIKRFNSLMSESAINGIILIVPTKPKIYPENLPSDYKLLCQQRPSWQENMVSTIDSNKLLYPVDQFYAWKEQFEVYHSKRFHWIGQAPYHTARWVLDSWNIKPDISPLISQRTITSDLNSYSLGLNFHNNGFVYDYSQKLSKQCVGKQCLADWVNHYQNGVLRYFRTQRSNGRSLLVLSDSFGPFIDEHFLQGFDTVWSVELNNLTEDEDSFFKWVISTTNPSHTIVVMHDGGTVSQLLRMNRVFSKW